MTKTLEVLWALIMFVCVVGAAFVGLVVIYWFCALLVAFL